MRIIKQAHDASACGVAQCGIVVDGLDSRGGAAVGAMVTMQQIADVAQVKRPVVSMWRKRHADGDTPFPQPVRSDKSEFRASDVAEWFRVTGLGNNPDAPDDIALHSSRMDEAVADAESASALLLIAARAGGPVESVSVPEAYEIALGIGDDRLLSIDDTETAMGRADVAAAVDDLSEAAYGATTVLELLAARVADDAAERSGEVLTAPGRRLVGAIAAELIRNCDGLVVPTGPGGTGIVSASLGELAEHGAHTFGHTRETRASVHDRVMWRSLLARGFAVSTADSPERASGDALVVAQWAGADVATGGSFFEWVDDLVVDMGQGGTVLVVGPASLMIDDLPGPSGVRRNELLSSPTYVAPLRYSARLPRGLIRSSGQKQLAVWVFARDATPHELTVFADHSAHRLDQNECTLTAADIAVAVSGADASRKHVFLRGDARASARYLRAGGLKPLLSRRGVGDGREVHAAVWAADDAIGAPILSGVGLEAVDSARQSGSRPWRAAVEGDRRLARVIKGVRLSADLIQPSQPGSAGVIGESELTSEIPRGRRGVDRLDLERVAPRTTFTEPGDVIYLPTKRRAAMVDRMGGHVVLAPARVLRCLDVIESDEQLVPHIVVEDILSQPSADVDGWMLRTVAIGQLRPLSVVQGRIDDRRSAVLAELAALDALQTELARGITSGVLRAEMTEHESTTGAAGSVNRMEN